MRAIQSVLDNLESIIRENPKERPPNTMTAGEARQIHTWSFGHPAAATSMVLLFKSLDCDINKLRNWLLSRNVPLGGTKNVTLEDINLWWSEHWQEIQTQLTLLTAGK